MKFFNCIKILKCLCSAGRPFHTCTTSSVKLTLQNCSECKIILFVLCVNRWLPVRHRITYKLLLLRIARKTSNLVTLLDSLTSYKPARTQHSSSCDLLIALHRVKIATAFRVASPTIWNILPDFVKVADLFNASFTISSVWYSFFNNCVFQPASLSRSLTSIELRCLKSIKLYCFVL